jgi:hypothetical protein
LFAGLVVDGTDHYPISLSEEIMINKKRSLMALGIILILCSLAWASPTPIVVCYPGGPVKGQDAQAAMGSMLRVVEKVGQWPKGTFDSVFTTKAEECKKLIREKKPSYSIMSLGLFLELKDQEPLLPIVQPKIKGKSTETYRILVQKGKYKTIQEFKDKSLSGTPLEEPGFLARIVFKGSFDPPAFFKLKPTKQALSALRSLDKGELDAVIVNEQQYAALGGLPFARQLEVIFSSDPIPLMGVTANEKMTSPEERTRFINALSNMCSDEEGKKLCDMFGVDSFAKVDAKTFEPMIQLWKKGAKK